MQTDEKNHVNFHIKQMMHNNTSGQRQHRKMLTDNSLHTSSLEMQSRHSHKYKPRFVRYKGHMTQTMNTNRLEMKNNKHVTLTCHTDDMI